MTALSPSAQRVQNALAAAGSSAQITEHENPGRTAAEAAELLGCDIAQIAKSIIFKNAATGTSVLVITSGGNRVDEKKVAAIIGEKLAKADAAFVREQTGFAIGGVPPIAHTNPGAILLDEDLLAFDTVFPAGGTPHAMFAVDPQELIGLSGARVANVALARL
ncbi:MAG: YbaK/EbsC family protein [Burkholderiales bacterium]|jgi:prolyl-tRNA editing enzyme YbaK/EbsC (Cys-tRNA(Pro) deacylase)|nr:YbaK/EbsC family protein [Burkholderiales bacterium]